MAKQKSVVIIMEKEYLRVVPYGDVRVKDLDKIFKFLRGQYKEQEKNDKIEDVTYGRRQG